MASYEESSGYCEYCQRHVVCRRQTPNHILHLLLTIFLCGIWVIPWILMSIQIGGWHCAYCGGGVRASGGGGSVLGWVALAVFVGIFVLGGITTLVSVVMRTPAPPARTATPAAPPGLDPVALARTNIGKTAFGKKDGLDYGEIITVARRDGDKVLCYGVRYLGQYRELPCDDYDARAVPSHMTERGKR